jgi:hypothetical protein
MDLHNDLQLVSDLDRAFLHADRIQPLDGSGVVFLSYVLGKLSMQEARLPPGAFGRIPDDERLTPENQVRLLVLCIGAAWQNGFGSGGRLTARNIADSIEAVLGTCEWFDPPTCYRSALRNAASLVRQYPRLGLFWTQFFQTFTP